ncbi:TIGR03557 family F420-dependent LLM class oxidoreductase [Rhizorhabdus dicambivorans]|uniref:LLM class F420-dependent oxidoreductase n=1 Tax=Rhizorhabdus dicambivorans TaxID=1850238 RepID=A0A2A4FWX2_9SPHN|nr:TIGR03557 family F420-dependent LLM class oxidoreductase [Rhizorhabdus dicambivorans]ATE65548.1 LLM class F420-dependent oxidoreductase [Rhizorhabdus dicambivorans]PCE41891.1 LLM class F420-dependent oxidoreductase [Rhizorhabdus dicambivorans]
MVKFGYKLMTEEHGPKALVDNAVRAEAAGFDFVSISDHFHPWLESQGHAPFAWSVLGGIAQATSRIGIATGLTCPIIRYHPAIVAQAAATIALMSDGRFTLAVGAGERLNEHVTGARWPSLPERHAMLAEAIDIFRALWQGGVQNWKGDYYVIDHAQLYDCPDAPIPVVVGVSGPHSVALAAEKGDGIMTTEPKAELVEGFRKSGKDGPRYAEALIAYAPSEKEGLELAHRQFRFSALGWAVNSELPAVQGFEAATKHVKPEDLADSAAAGPDPDRAAAFIRRYIEAGYDHVVLTCPGPDQAGFIDFFEKQLRPKLG